MEENKIPQWLNWAREIQQLSQTGLAFAVTDYEKQRYKRLTEITSEIVEHHTSLEKEAVEKVMMNYLMIKMDTSFCRISRLLFAIKLPVILHP